MICCQTYPEGLNGRVHRGHHAEHDKHVVRDPLPTGACTGPEMEHRRVYVAKGHAVRVRATKSARKQTARTVRQGDAPSKAADEGNKLVQVRRTQVADDRADHDDAKAEEILQPLDLGVALAAARKETRLHDAHRREQLERDREEDCSGVQKLDLNTIQEVI